MTTKKQEDVRRRIETNARSYNKYLTKAYVRNIPIRELLGLAHPANRLTFIKELKKAKTINEDQEKNLEKHLT